MAKGQMEKNTSIKATRQKVFEMRKLRSEGWKLKDIAKKYGVKTSVVSKICRYETHVHTFF